MNGRLSVLPAVEIVAYTAASCLGGSAAETWDALLAESWGFSTVDLAVQNRPRVHAGVIAELGVLDAPDRLVRLGALLLERLLAAPGVAKAVTGAERCALLLGISLGDLGSGEAPQETVRRIAERFGFQDWRCISSACASSADAIGLAAAMIARGALDAAVCGGIDIVDTAKLAGHFASGTLSPTACRPFDADRDGTLLADGGAVLALRRATPEGRLFVRGYGTAADASGLTSPSPDARGALLSMSRALSTAGLSLAEVGYINAHGSGTAVNDLVEAMALESAGAASVPVSSTKGGTGHCLGAAGSIEAAVCLEALRRGHCPPSVRLSRPLAEHALTWVPAGGVPMRRTVALSNSFGFGGSCTTLIFSGGGAPGHA